MCVYFNNLLKANSKLSLECIGFGKTHTMVPRWKEYGIHFILKEKKNIMCKIIFGSEKWFIAYTCLELLNSVIK